MGTIPDDVNIRYTIDTTFLILDGLLEYERMHPNISDKVIEAQKLGREFLLQHHLF